MCGVVDKVVAFEVFGDRQTDAGKGFRDWLDRRGGSLAVGGDLLDELDGNGKFKEWYTRNEQTHHRQVPLRDRCRLVVRTRTRQRQQLALMRHRQ